MPKIKNQYTMWWETLTGIIQNDYTQSFYDKNIDFSTMKVTDPSTGKKVCCVSTFEAATVAEIDAFVVANELIDPDMIVTPH